MPRGKKANTQPKNIDMSHATTLPITVQQKESGTEDPIKDSEITVQIDGQNSSDTADNSVETINNTEPEPIGIDETIVKDDSGKKEESEEPKEDSSEQKNEDDTSEPKDEEKRFTSEQMNAIISRKIKDSQDEVSQLKKQNEELTKQVEAAKKEGMVAGQIDALREQTAAKFGIKKSLIPMTKEDIEEFNKQLDKYLSNNLRVVPAKTKQKKEEDDNGPIQGVIAGGTFLQ